MSSFNWNYFFYFVGGMVFLYWLVFTLGLWVKDRLKGFDSTGWFKRDRGVGGFFLGAILGAVTPFCSCSTIPVFVGLIQSGIPLGYAMSFLISSPIIDPVAIVLFTALFGWRHALIYVGACFVLSVVGGMALSNRSLRKYLLEIWTSPEDDQMAFSFRNASTLYLRFLRSLLPVLIIAGAFAGFLRGWIPSESLLSTVSQYQIIAIPTVVLLGGMIYSDIGMLVPVGHLLLTKGMHTAVVFAFLMAASGVSIPCIILLSRIMRKPLLVLYLLTIFILYTSTGYLFAWLNIS